MPEARIILAQAVVHLALAPKSNAGYLAIDAAIADVRAGLAGPVPAAPARRALRRGAAARPRRRATGTRTTTRAASSPQQYAPDDAGRPRRTTTPTDHGAERELADGSTGCAPCCADEPPARLSSPWRTIAGDARSSVARTGAPRSRTPSGRMGTRRDRSMSVRRASPGSIAALRVRAARGRLAGLPPVKLGKVLDETRLTRARPVRRERSRCSPRSPRRSRRPTASSSRVDAITTQRGAGDDERLGADRAVRGHARLPVVKVAAFTYGVRQAVDARSPGPVAPARGRR